jgi:hypothetical protein
MWTKKEALQPIQSRGDGEHGTSRNEACSNHTSMHQISNDICGEIKTGGALSQYHHQFL